MTYKNWSVVISQERNGLVVDYADAQGNVYSEPFCFYSYEEAETYGKLCVDQAIRSASKLDKLI